MGVTDAGRVTSHPTAAAARVYSAFAYLAFAVSATWAIAFLADLRTVPVIDRAPSGPAWVAVLVDLGLLLVFALQHSVMARAGVKRRMARVVPAAIERSTYVLSTSLCLLARHHPRLDERRVCPSHLTDSIERDRTEPDRDPTGPRAGAARRKLRESIDHDRRLEPGPPAPAPPPSPHCGPDVQVGPEGRRPAHQHRPVRDPPGHPGLAAHRRPRD
jgi:hypothetical protein